MNTKYIIAALVLIALAAGAYVISRGQPETITPPQNQMQSYSSATHGIAFQYPQSYALEERTAQGASAPRHTIVIADREALAEAPENGEGPTSITVDIFPNPSGQTPEAWVRSNNQSNFQLAVNGTLATSNVSGKSAVAYTWDGLYRGDSYVFAHTGNILMFSVTYMTPEDTIRDDFARLLQTLELQ